MICHMSIYVMICLCFLKLKLAQDQRNLILRAQRCRCRAQFRESSASKYIRIIGKVCGQCGQLTCMTFARQDHLCARHSRELQSFPGEQTSDSSALLFWLPHATTKLWPSTSVSSVPGTGSYGATQIACPFAAVISCGRGG